MATVTVLSGAAPCQVNGGAQTQCSTFQNAGPGAVLYSASPGVQAAPDGTCSGVESSQDSGLWKAPGWTTDGIHPTTGSGHPAMGATMTVAQFT